MYKHRTKTCCHCGRETHAQPQDYNHDKGYGHCYDCLKMPNWYIASFDQLTPDIRIYFYDHRDRNNGPISRDDSHAKVIEVIIKNKVEYHQTLHCTKEAIRQQLKKKYLEFRD